MESFVQSSSEHLKKLRQEVQFKFHNEKKFEWGYLRKKCRNLELEQFYEAYVHRLRLSSMSVLVILIVLIMVAHSIILVSTTLAIGHVYFDVIVYISSSAFVWLVLSVNFNDELIKRNPCIMHISSWLAVTLLVAADLSVPIYHAYTNQDILRPSYGVFVIYSIYLLMPLSNNLHAFILGISVTICYLIIYGYITFLKHPYSANLLNVPYLLTEVLFLLLVNMLGIFYRMTKEITIRTTFLDRRQCVEENLLLRYARDQEKNLLLSIIPSQIANKIEHDVKMRIERLKVQNSKRSSVLEGSSIPPVLKHWRHPDTEKLFIEPHDDVTILYADVVNYTYLTTTLDVKTLVETLHDLFVRFDTASEEHNVLRIKFLGDCYYCVAGVPIPNEQHARCCIELGLRMIKDIREVRSRRKLNIDMRIGVHSGSILSGVIGACKWQFDIWSKDVDIASRLEATGLAGRVHVSEQTLKLLDGEYLYEEGTVNARNDAVLQKYHIRSFLIKQPRSPTFVDWKAPVIRPYIPMRASTKLPLNTNFMQNTNMQYNLIRNQAKLEMSRELDKMPISRIQFAESCFGRSKRLTLDELEERTFRSNITSVGLFFKDWHWEIMYMKEPDVMLKYSVLFAFIVLIGIMTMQVICNAQSIIFWSLMGFYFAVMLIILFLTWYRKIWIILYAETEASIPNGRISKFFFNSSYFIKNSIVIRLLIYLTMIVMYCTTAFLQMADCNRPQIENEETEGLLFEETRQHNFCFNAWGVTESVILIIGVSFLFTRIPFMVKASVSVIVFAAYIVLVALEFDFIYEESPSTNVGLYPEYAHCMVLLISLVVFYLMDRQTEFITKVDFNWKRQLLKKQDDAKFTNETIKILIHNILPSHVADIYISKKMKNELYYEEYENVAVMFASIRNYDTDKVGLRVLNEIICDFDDVLNTYKGPLKVEKIKVAGWTYMAACGLDLSRSENVTTNVQNFRNSALLPNGRRSHYTEIAAEESLPTGPSTSTAAAEAAAATLAEAAAAVEYEGHNDRINTRKSRKISHPQQSNVVHVMTQFALDLMRSMNAFNQENMVEGKDCGMLRIGISNGEIMAGVVGSYKPHYDIWGNAVNLASRLDSTGIPGRIQVTERTANILSKFDIMCTIRGLTYVKGIGEISTYFVDVDSDLNFVSSESKSKSKIRFSQ